jgi:outer membrane protein assembly factor BamA
MEYQISALDISYGDKEKNRMIQLILILIILSGNRILAQQAIWYVESIIFSGNNNVDKKELLSIMQLQPPDFFTRSTYSFTELTDDILRIEQFYDGKGYLNSNVHIENIDRDSTDNGVRIRLRVNEGTQTIIDSIVFKSNTIFSDSVLMAIIPLKINAPLDSLRFAQSDRTIQDSLASRGLLFAKVDKSMQFNEDRGNATIV